MEKKRAATQLEAYPALAAAIGSGLKAVRRPGRARRRSMAKGQKRSNKEVRKPKKDKPKKGVAAPSKGLIKDSDR